MTCRVLVGDCIEQMRTLRDESVQACITSPPYFGLRDYGVDGQIGLEDTVDDFVARLVEVFREVRRVLRNDGTLWLNLGDSYAANRSYQVNSTKGCQKHGVGQSAGGKGSRVQEGLKQKDLIGIPWRVAFALQADGWYLRQDIIWSKPNPMPESVRDRCTKAHEYIFLLSKAPKYHFNHEAVKEPMAASSLPRLRQNVSAQAGTARANGGAKSNGNFKAAGNVESGMRNRRSVWTVTTKPFKDAHFATYPPDLIEPCVLAGCPAGGVILDPFAGSGTTGGVAIKHGRNAVLCELNPAYAALIPARVAAISGSSLRLSPSPLEQVYRSVMAAMDGRHV